MVDSFECCELAAYILGIKEYEDEEEVWEQMYEKHEFEIELVDPEGKLKMMVERID